jgi:folate-binding Fe-S cluster repair protein YgfZ
MPDKYIAEMLGKQFSTLDGSGGWVTKLDSRKVLSIRGPESQTFLQGLMTSDINQFKKDGMERGAIFTTFLNVKGKIIFDAIIARPLLANQKDDDMEFWMEVAQEDLEAAIKHLKVS